MKILQVVHYFPPSGLGGSELHTCQLSKELLKSHDVRLFFTISDNKVSEKIEQGCYNGIPYWALKKDYCTFDQPFHERSKWVEREFSKILLSFKPDIIHFQHLSNLSLALPALAKKACIPCCFTLHDFWLLCPRTFFLDSEMKICDSYSPARCADCMQDRIGYYTLHCKGSRPVRFAKYYAKQVLNFKKKITLLLSIGIWRVYWVRKIFKAVTIFIAPSEFLRARFVMHNLSSKKIICIPHGSTTKLLSAVKKTSSPIPRFAFIGALRLHKGINLLIDAFNAVAAPYKLRLYGRITPAFEADLKKRITNPHIHIMGELRDEDKQKAFSEIDVLIVPSICYESYSLVIDEAFIAKTPVIVSDIGALAERVKDGVTGLTFPPGDSAALAQKITLFIKDRTLQDRLASGIPAVKDISVYCSEIVQLYNRLIV
jgi:glycosyltransferase involved in cell wall biosynthesis